MLLTSINIHRKTVIFCKNLSKLEQDLVTLDNGILKNLSIKVFERILLGYIQIVV